MSYKSHYEIAREWAAQSRASRKNKSFLFEGDTIYSYGKHWPLAKRICIGTGADYQRLALINPLSDRRSPTTSRHSTVAVRAAHCSTFVDKQLRIDVELWDSITDAKSLAKAITKAEEFRRDRVYEDKLAAREKSRQRRHWAVVDARNDLGNFLSIPEELIEEMSGAMAIRLRDMVSTPRYAFSAYRDRVADTPLTEFISALITQQPHLVKRPIELTTLISAFKQLAA